MPLNAAEILVALGGRGGPPLRVRLTMALRDAIRRGQLVAGTTLPSSRVLARDLGISRGVVVEAYAQLAAEGFVLSRKGAGTTVARLPSITGWTAAPPPPLPPTTSTAIDLRPAMPDLSFFPRRAWGAAIRQAIATMPTSGLGYVEPWGTHAARNEVAQYLARVRGAMTSADGLLIVHGVTQGIALLARVLQRLGHSAIAVEDPSNALQRHHLRGAGLQVIDVPVDEHGLRVELLAQSGARAVICTPAHQYPTGAILPAERRDQLCQWAQDAQGLIVEDDYDAEFRYGHDPVGCLQGLDPGHVALLGSVSKTLAPGLRLGWLAPPAHLLEVLRAEKSHADYGGDAFQQYALTDFIASGAYDRQLRAVRRRYALRRAAFVAALQARLPGWQVMGSAGGLHVTVLLPEELPENQLVEAARAVGVEVLGAATMSGTYRYPPALVLSYAASTTGMLEDAASRLAHAADVVRTCG
ncbi:MAG: PLP-dependent aminotransferase family protein [Actinomycetota bacterium]|nr:PLP-dependent aminotransferase family protein [Actinomycetota bacterium]